MAKTEKNAETFSIPQIRRMFPDDDACIKWLEQVRWNGDPVCGHCGCGGKVSQAPSKPHTYWCGDCRMHFNVQTNTILHGTRTPLQNWMLAIYSVMTARKGISAMQLSKEIGVQYRTAWYMLHRVWEACESGEFKLDGVVEMDECFVGGKEANKHQSKKLKTGRGTVGKVPVMGARQRDGRTIARPVGEAIITFGATMAGNVAMAQTVIKSWSCEPQNSSKMPVSLLVGEESGIPPLRPARPDKGQITGIKGSSSFKTVPFYEMGMIRVWRISESHFFIIKPDKSIYVISDSGSYVVSHCETWKNSAVLATFDCKMGK